MQLQGHLHYGVKLFVFAYDVGQDFIEVGREEVRYGGHELLNESPDLLGDGKFDCLGRYFTEQASDGLV